MLTIAVTSLEKFVRQQTHTESIHFRQTFWHLLCINASIASHSQCKLLQRPEKPVSSKEGGLNAVFDSLAESFLSQKGQSTHPTEIEFC